MTSQKVAMTLATLARLGSGIAVFVVMARFLGPAQFGLISGAMAFSGLLNLLSDFGLASYALRAAGARPHLHVEIARQALCLKAAMTLAPALGGMVLLASLRPGGREVEVQSLVFIALTLAAFTDLAFVVTRAIGKIWIEARLVSWTSLLSVFIVAGAAFATRDVVWTAWAFMASRALYALVVLWTLRQWLFRPGCAPIRRQDLVEMARDAWPYALDGALTNLSNQIDVVVLALMLGPAALGIYQAGARLAQSIAPFAVILSTLYLPRLSYAHHHGDQALLKSLAGRLTLEFMALAAIGWLGFSFGGPLWTEFVLGPEYASLDQLWPGFAAFVFFRLLASSFGVQLAAFGEMKFRIGSQALAILFVIVGDGLFARRFGVTTASWILAGSSLILLVVYAKAATRVTKAMWEARIGIMLTVAVIVGESLALYQH